MQLEQPIDSSRLETSLHHIMALYGDQLVRLKGLIFDPAFDHPLLIQGSVGVLYPPAHLPVRKSDESVSRLVLITTGELNGLANEIMNGMGMDNKIEFIG
jgi:G3E family GTPase